MLLTLHNEMIFDTILYILIVFGVMIIITCIVNDFSDKN